MKGIMFLSLVMFVLTPLITKADTTPHLLITQVQITGGTGATNNDFIEIFNPTIEDVDLIGHYIVRRTKTGTSDFIITLWTQSTIIPAGKFYLLAHEDFTTIASSPDRVFTEPLSNDNGIALKSPANVVVDSVGWGEATNAFVENIVFPINPTADNSLARKFDLNHIATETDNNSEDFEVVVANPRNLNFIWPEPVEEPVEEPEVTPEEEPEVEIIYSTNVKISEVLINPLNSDAGNEWVELYALADADISGWILDDEGITGVVGSSALNIPQNTHISAGAYLVFQIPSGKFALNNTGGDTLRLIHPDFNLADSITYSSPAPQAQSYAKNSLGSFAWTTLVTKGGANQFPEDLEEEVEEEVTLASEEEEVLIDFIHINEVFPNPEGNDSGMEFIELINVGDISVALGDWIIDDGDTDSTIGSTRIKLQNLQIAPAEILLIKIPKGKFTLNNIGDETVRLFDAHKRLIDAVSFSGSLEGKSYSLVEDEWFWGPPTPGEINQIEEEIEYSDEILINSLLPEPNSGEEEYIELINRSGVEVSLTDWVIADEAREFKIKDVIIPAGATYRIAKSESKISLNNFGAETVTLFNPLGEVVAQVEYDDPPKGYALTFSGDKTGPLVRTGAWSKPRGSVIVFSIILWYIYIVFSHKNKEI